MIVKPVRVGVGNSIDLHFGVPAHFLAIAYIDKLDERWRQKIELYFDTNLKEWACDPLPDDMPKVTRTELKTINKLLTKFYELPF